MDKIIEILKIVLQKLYNVSGLKTLTYQSVLTLLALTVVAFIIEYIFIDNKKESSIYKIVKLDKSVINDIICWVIDGMGLFVLGGVLLTFGSFYFVTVWIYKHPEYHLNFSQKISNPYLQFILLFLLRDLKTYFVHRLFHRSKPLWHLHAFHHSSDKFVAISAHRGHFVEGMVSGVFDALIFMVLGSPLINLFYIGYLTEMQGLLVHSNIKSNWGFIGKYILISPANHRLHHSDNEKHFNKNFGGIFVFWDRIFNTYFAPNDEVITIGVPNSHYNKQGYIYDMLYSYWLFLRDSFYQVKDILISKRK